MSILQFVAIACCAAQRLSRRTQTGLAVYTSLSDFDVLYERSNADFLTTSEIFTYEQATAEFMSQLLSETTFLADYKILSTNVKVRDQAIESVTSKLVYIKVIGTVELVYSGQSAISELPSILYALVTRPIGDELLDELKNVGLADKEVTSPELTFTKSELLDKGPITLLPDEKNADQDSDLQSNSNTRIVVACFSLAALLLVVSLVLLWISGEFGGIFCSRSKDAQKEPYGYDSSKVEKEPEPMPSPNGVLGANGFRTAKPDKANHPGIAEEDESERDSVNLTPRRGLYREYESDTSSVVTPLSASDSVNKTNVSEASAASSNRMPLGIRSMRKLNRMLTPEKRSEKKGLYDF